MSNLAGSHSGPEWAPMVLACPQCHSNISCVGNELCCTQCGPVGRWEQGIARFGARTDDPSVQWYKAIGGAHFYERLNIPFTMSSLDTPIYAYYLEHLKPHSQENLIVDLGAGDGRNTEPWLIWGYRRVIATDAIFSSLARFRTRLAHEHPDWLEHLLLVECDMRQLPIASLKATLVLAIEALGYLNENYELGLSECRRLLNRGGRLMISERSWEGALLTRLLYGGAVEMLELCESRYLYDGYENNLVRSRTFTEEELLNILERARLTALEQKGLPLLPLVFGYLRQERKLPVPDQQYLQDLRHLLTTLGDKGKMRRTHVVVAEKHSGANSTPSFAR